MVKNKIKTSLLIVFIGVINLLVHFGCPPLTMNAVSATIVNGGELFVKTDVQKRSEMQLQQNWCPLSRFYGGAKLLPILDSTRTQEFIILKSRTDRQKDTTLIFCLT
jgi:hypothetical protein